MYEVKNRENVYEWMNIGILDLTIEDTKRVYNQLNEGGHAIYKNWEELFKSVYIHYPNEWREILKGKK